MLGNIYEFFQASPWYNILALSITLVGTLYGIASFFIGNRKRIPMYIIETSHLIREIVKDHELRIIYKGQEYPSITSTRFVFWNRGRKVIKGDDIATKKPIKITIDNKYQILDAFIAKQTNTDNNFVLEKSKDNKCLTIKFEFLEYNDGIAIRILHTAPSDDELHVSGKVISGSKLRNAQSGKIDKGLKRILSFIRFEYLPIRERYSIARFLIFLMGLLIIVDPLISHANILLNHNDSIWYYIIIYPLGGFYILLTLFGIRRYVPKELEE